MNRFLLCCAAFLLTFGGGVILERPNPVLLNGKPLANAVKVNGILYIPVADLAKGAGGSPTLEPTLKLQGNTLTAAAHKHIAGVKYEDVNVQFQVRKAGEISSHVIMKDGKAWVPLGDVAKAFGAIIINYDSVKPGEPIRLNLTVNGDDILAINH